jgi:hypothetical protein
MLPCSFLLDFLLIGDLMMFLIGAYDDEEAAARAYDLAALKYWGPGTLINFPVRLLLTWFFLLNLEMVWISCFISEIPIWFCDLCSPVA